MEHTAGFFDLKMEALKQSKLNFHYTCSPIMNADFDVNWVTP